jgi:hypothetical protein
MFSALLKPTAALVLRALGKAGTLLAMVAPTLILLLETQLYILAGDLNQQCLATLEEYLLGFCSLRTFPTEESYTAHKLRRVSLLCFAIAIGCFDVLRFWMTLWIDISMMLINIVL